METFFNNKNLFDFIWKWRKIYGIVAIITIIASVIFSGSNFIRPKFKSYAIIYPSNLQRYSNESYTEQMLQILQSEQLKFRLIKVFHLYSHYDIDKTSKHMQTNILKELDNNISISKTPYESVEIDVLDYSPDTAKIMVDSIISFYNQLVRNIQNKKYKEIIDIGQVHLSNLYSSRDSLMHILNKYRENFGIFKPKLQTVEITKRYLTKNDNTSKTLYQNLLKNSENISLLDSLLEFNKRQIVGYKNSLDEAIKNYRKKISYVNIVSSPFQADKKSYPIRWVILVLSVLGTFLFTFIVLIFFESFQKKEL